MQGQLVNSRSRVAFWQTVHSRLGVRERPHQDYQLQWQEAAPSHGKTVVRAASGLLGATLLQRGLWVFYTLSWHWQGSPHQAQYLLVLSLLTQEEAILGSYLLSWTERRQGLKEPQPSAPCSNSLSVLGALGEEVER